MPVLWQTLQVPSHMISSSISETLTKAMCAPLLLLLCAPPPPPLLLLLLLLLCRSVDEARLQFLKANRAGMMKKVWDPQDTATAFWSA